MEKISIFFITIVLGIIFSYSFQNKESFLSKKCNTLLCQKKKYSVTSIKNAVSNKFTTVTSGHIDNIKKHLSKFKERWL